MPNPHLIERLQGIQNLLMAGHRASSTMSSAVKGREREDFMDKFLRHVLPPTYRFGTGDITDSRGAKSGQLDIVIEKPFLPSLHVWDGKPRLYLAESVAAVIEVKSNLAYQWAEAEESLKKVRWLWRDPVTRRAPDLRNIIPFFAVGYAGWKEIETVKKRLDSPYGVNGILIIENFTFVQNNDLHSGANNFGKITVAMNEVQGPMGLWGSITALHQVTVGYGDDGSKWIVDYAR